MMKLSRVIWVVFIGLFLVLQAHAEESLFSETFGDFQEELQTAKEEGKKGIFVFFEMDECPFCHRMKTTIFNQPDVIEAVRKDFLAFRWDIEGDTEVVDFDGQQGTMRQLAEKKYRVRATPVMIFFDLNGKPIVRITGPTRTKQEFLWLLEFVRDGHYKTMKFARFKRMKAKQAR